MAVSGVVLAFNLSMAQNYKAPKIDATGGIYDMEGKKVGSVNKKGEIMDEMGMKMAYVDGNGVLVDAKTGKKLGKAEKNGNYTFYTSPTPDGKGLTTTPPANGTCYVKTAEGKVVMEVHENYKMYGACAAHCLQNNMKHTDVMEKSKPAASAIYSCSMHPEITSEKPGKCSKCGMDLTKK